jgi:hypothetical protein
MTSRLVHPAKVVAWLIVFVAVALGIMVATRSILGSMPIPGRTTPPLASLLDHTDVVALGGDLYDLVYDVHRDAIWAAVFSLRDPDELVRVDAESEDVRRWPLPETEHNGYLGQIELDEHGVVWVFANYSLARFDPATEVMRSVVLPEEVEDAIPTALDRDDPLPGTWISSIAVIDDRVLVARNNVPYLTQFGPTLEASRDIDLPANYMGARDVARRGASTYVLSGPKAPESSWAEITAGAVVVWADDGYPEERFVTFGERLMTSSGRTIVGPETSRTLGPGSLAAFDIEGRIVAFDHSTSRITVTFGGDVIQEASLPTVNIEFYPPPPETEAVVVNQAPPLTAIVVDTRGAFWYAVRGDQGLRRIATESH